MWRNTNQCLRAGLECEFDIDREFYQSINKSSKPALNQGGGLVEGGKVH